VDTSKNSDRPHLLARAGFWLARLNVALVFVAASSVATAGDVYSPELAPANPQYLDYLVTKALTGRAEEVLADGQPATGYVPPPFDISHMTGMVPRDVLATRATLPGTFDLRATGMVTPVRNQGACGDCWAFATMGSLESNMLMAGAGTYNFSENHLNVRSGFDIGACKGGNASMATAYLIRWGNADGFAAGPVFETDDPYTSTTATSVSGLSPRFHHQETLYLPNRASYIDNTVWKTALQQYGALDVAFYVNTGNAAYWNSSTAAYYYSGSSGSNHEVTIVGWDDNYSASNFSTTPPGNGAYIVKNSWGTGWGKQGYFYLSYYDTSLGYASVFRADQSTGNYARQYAYDPLGMTSGASFAWAANVFTAQASESLAAVGFFTTSVNGSYELYIYTGTTGSPTSGTLRLSIAGTQAYAGYHTVVLPNAVALTAGEQFAVVMKETTPGYGYPAAIEDLWSGYSSAARASAGQSFYSQNGTSWYDLAALWPDANVTIRAFTSAATGTAAAFNDIANSWAVSYINAIAAAGITTGCGGGNYCPTLNVTRDQMAAFIIRAKEGEPTTACSTAPFADVPATSGFCKYIQRLAALGITTGCGSGNYCPGQVIDRQQAAAFLVRAVVGEPATDYCGTTNPFTDVSYDSAMCGYIKRLAELGITAGCGGGNFCPAGAVTRDQMAAFLARAFLGM